MKRTFYLVLFYLVQSTFAQGQSEFYYYLNDSIVLVPDSNKCTIEFIGTSNESFLLNEGINFSKMGNNYYEVNGDFETTKNTGLGVYHTQKVYHTLDGLCLRVKSEIVLKFKSDVSTSSITSIEQHYGLTLIDDHPGWFKVYSTSTPIENAILLNETGLVDFCDPNFILPLTQCAHHPNDEFYDRQWHLNNVESTIFNDGTTGTPNSDINAPEAWDLTTGDPDVKIGVQYDVPQHNHPDLPEARIERNGATTIVDNHGTAVCGIIGAEMDNNIGTVGVAPQCKMRLWNSPFYDPYSGTLFVWPLSMENQVLYGYTELSNYAYSFVDMVTNGCRVVTHSGAVGGNMSTVQSVVNTAMNNGLVIVRAALNISSHYNNFNQETSPIDFVNIPNILIVGASDRNDMQADYSPTSSYIDLCAPSAKDFKIWQSSNKQSGTTFLGFEPIPGEECQVWTLDITGDADNTNGDASMWDWNPTGITDPTSLLFQNQYPSTSICGNHLDYTGRFWGTSAATPQVAAVAALMISANNLLTVPEVVQILTSTAVKSHPELYDYQWNSELPGHSKELGYGRLDAHAAVQAAIDAGHVKFTATVTDYSCNSNDEASFALFINLEEGEDISDYHAYLDGVEIALTVNPQSIELPAPVGHVQLLKVTNSNYTCIFDDLPASSTRQIFIDHAPPMFEPAQVENVTCLGGTDGGIYLELICQKETNFTWTLDDEIIANNTTAVLLENLEAGQYNLTVTNFLGCSNATTVQVSEPNQNPPIVSLISTPSSCSDSNDGSVCSTISSGLAPYSLLWSNGDNSTCINELAAGPYSLTITDANGCSVLASSNVEVPDPITALVGGTLQTSCIETCDATAELTISGGTGSNTISWPTGIVPAALCAGSYDVVIVDENDCQLLQTVTTVLGTTSCCPLEGIHPEIIIQEECFYLPGANIVFANYSSALDLSFEWDFGDGSTSTDQTTTHAFENPGMYSVTLTIGSWICDPVVLTASVEILEFDYPMMS
jgi:subtilisin family serine protease